MGAVFKRSPRQGVLRLYVQEYDGRIQSGLPLLVVLVRAGKVQYEVGAGEFGGGERIPEEGGGPGRVVGPFNPNVLPRVDVSHFGVIPNSHRPSEWRLIVDLSHPHRSECEQRD